MSHPKEPTLLEYRSYLEERRNFHLNVFLACPSELSPSQLIANLDALEDTNKSIAQLVIFLNKSIYSSTVTTY